jgi:ABC-2 type transport system permease protein
MYMKKYFRVYKTFFNNSISYFFQYRSDAFVNIFFHLFWMATIFLMIEILFGHTTLLAGWTRGETYVLSLFWMLSDEICIFFFSNNLHSLASKINEGTLDILVTKPINTLFFVSTQYVGVRAIQRFITYFGALIYVIVHFDIPFTILNSIVAFFFLLCGICINYSITLILNTLNFWFEKIENINILWDTLLGTGKYPLDVFTKGIRIIFLTFLPIAYIAYYPTTVVLGKISWIMFGVIPLFTAFLLIVAVSFWNFSLKRYSSASS